MQLPRVLVCGTNYGRTYLEAIHLAGETYRLAGILARGSTRSLMLTQRHCVPLYRSLEDLPAEIDLACAAMGENGRDVVLGLLERGIHVLCEHPVRRHWLQAALEKAASRGLSFHVNGHFAELPAARAFIGHCHDASRNHPACFLEVTCTDRSLYTVLDIVRRALPKFAPFEFQAVSRSTPFTTIQGVLGAVPISFHLQGSAGGCPLPDGDPGYLVDQRIVAGFPTGILTLLSVNGPVVWNTNLNSTLDTSNSLFVELEAAGALTKTLLRQQRVAANLAAIEALTRAIREHVVPAEQTPTHLLEVSSAWAALGSLL